MARRPTSRAAGKVKRTKARAAPATEARRKAKRAAPAKPATKASATKRKTVKPAAVAKATTKTKAPAAAKTSAAKARAAKAAALAKTRAKAAPPKSASSKTTSAKPVVTTSAAAKPKAAKPAKAAKPTPRKPARAPRASEQLYLAAELGQPVDHEGEPIGAGSPMAQSDAELQRYSLELWRQMQSRRVANRHVLAMERAGVTIDDLWTAGVTDRLTTSSTEDEVRRYRQNLLFRANLLESILSETVAELRRLETVEPTPSTLPSEPPPSPAAAGPS